MIIDSDTVVSTVVGGVVAFVIVVGAAAYIRSTGGGHISTRATVV